MSRWRGVGRPVPDFDVRRTQKRELERVLRTPTTLNKTAYERASCCYVLSLPPSEQRLGVGLPCVNKCSTRSHAEGIVGLTDRPGSGAQQSIPEHAAKRVIEIAEQAPPCYQCWSKRKVAAVWVVSDAV